MLKTDQVLKEYLSSPSKELWNKLYSEPIPNIVGIRTFWQAWIFVDGGAPTELSQEVHSNPNVWPRIPDSFTLRRAIRAAQEGKIPLGLEKLLEDRQKSKVSIKKK